MLTQRKQFLLIGATLFLLGLSLVIFQVTGGDTPQKESPAVGYLAPDFTLPNLNGDLVRLSDFRGKKAVFINFWATWCPPCRLEMPTMEKAYQTFRGHGLEILAASIDAGPKSVVKNFMQEFKLNFPALLDPEMEVMQLYRLSAIPASFLVDKQGIIRYKELGYRDWTDGESTKILKELIR